MIGQYIYELLKVNSRVIIPDFGAFLVKEKPGGKMEVSYNDFLKFNDGLLVNKVIKTENISKTEATKKIKDFIKEVEAQLQKGERYILESVGEFYKDDFNRIKFDAYKPEKEKSIAAEVSKKGEASPEEKQEKLKQEDKPETAKATVDKKEDKTESNGEKKPEPKAAKEEPKARGKETGEEKKEEAKPEVKPAEEETAPTDKKEEPVREEEKQAEEKKETPKPEAKADKPKEESKTASEKTMADKKKEEESLASQITAKIAKETEKKADKEVKKDEPKVAEILDDSEMMHSAPTSNKGTRTLIWVSVVVVVLAAIITWFVLDYDRIMTWFDKAEQEVVDEPTQVVPEESTTEAEAVTEEAAEPQPVVEDQEETTKEMPAERKEEPTKVVEEQPAPVVEKPVSSGPKYYVIAGSFKVEQNAINYTKKLKAEGYNAENLGLIKGYHIVTFDGFESYEDALKLYKMVKADQPDAWVMKH